MHQHAILRWAALLALAGLAACSGGPNSSPAPTGNSGSGTGSGNSAQQNATSTISLDGSGAAYAIPGVGDYSGTVSFGTLTLAQPVRLTINASLAAPAAAQLSPQALRRTSSGSLDVLFYVTFTSPVTLSLPRLPAFTLTLPATVPTTGQFYYAISDPTSPNPGITFRTEGPASVSGRKVSFASSDNPLTLQAGKSYTFAFYEASAAAAKHVLLISVDGLHQVDLANYIRSFPTLTLAQLAQDGVIYTGANTSNPSDSFPGLMNLVTGGSPASTGVYYDVSYDRALSAPTDTTCASKGTTVAYDESIDRNSNALDGGGGINTSKLPRDGNKGCMPVYPHSFLRVNTIFEVIKNAGLGRTAWSDKHLAYDIVNGPSGAGVDDLYNPEIAATDGTTVGTEAYDDLKVTALLHEIDGYDHTGTSKVGMPVILGMNFQAVSVTQKLAGDGYVDAAGTPSSALAGALAHTDASLGKLVTELKATGNYNSTVIIVTAKHGQSPIDQSKIHKVDPANLEGAVNKVAPLAGDIEDDSALLWLKNSSQRSAVASALQTAGSTLGVLNVFALGGLPPGYGTPGDSRPPDVLVQSIPGTIYTTGSKIAEHGGFAPDDRNVALLVSFPGLAPTLIGDPVSTAQVAPTILTVLGIEPTKLQAVQKEGTPILPGLGI
jgi:hypothetical protein